MQKIALRNNETRYLSRGEYSLQEGCLWLTISGQDIIMAAGETRRLTRRTLVQALSAAELCRHGRAQAALTVRLSPDHG